MPLHYIQNFNCSRDFLSPIRRDVGDTARTFPSLRRTYSGLPTWNADWILNKREIRATSCDVDSTSYLPHGTMIIHIWPIKLRFECGSGHMLKDFYHMTTIDKTITEMREAIEDSSQRSVVELFQGKSSYGIFYVGHTVIFCLPPIFGSLKKH